MQWQKQNACWKSKRKPIPGSCLSDVDERVLEVQAQKACWKSKRKSMQWQKQNESMVIDETPRCVVLAVLLIVLAVFHNLCIYILCRLVTRN